MRKNADRIGATGETNVMESYSQEESDIMEEGGIQEVIPESMRQEEADVYVKLDQTIHMLEERGENVEGLKLQVTDMVTTGKKLKEIMDEIDKQVVRDKDGNPLCVSQ